MMVNCGRCISAKRRMLLCCYLAAAMAATRPVSVQPFSPTSGFVFGSNGRGDRYGNPQRRSRMRVVLYLEDPELLRPPPLSYDDTDGASRGIVSTLTAMVNSFSSTRRPGITKRSGGGGLHDTIIGQVNPPWDGVVVPPTTANINAAAASAATSPQSTPRQQQQQPPAEVAATTKAPATSPEELLERIRADYVERNYLWTGDLDLSCFVESCRFTDPTLTFVGTDTFRRNTQNLVPLVNDFVTECKSDLLSIRLHRDGDDDGGGGGYVETRWNMVGSLARSPFLFWKPRIDVIGRTKFWFRPTLLKVMGTEGGGERSSNDNSIANGESASEPSTTSSHCYKVYFYDEAWEIPAYQALLQLITPPGTFPNSRLETSE
jgi:Uncharacterized conserved protein (DUF2358)